MWILKAKINCSEGILGSRTKKFKIDMLAYPIFSHCIGNKIYLYNIFHLFGNEMNKKRFLKDLKKDPRFINFEQNGDMIITQIIEDSKYMPAYGPEVFPIEPVFIYKNGKEIWSLGSWKKNALIKASQLFSKYHRGVLLKLSKSKVQYVSLINVFPNLSKKQKTTMNLAIKSGYYDFPKKIKLIELAREMKVSYSTFQAHLKKAEQKLIPHIFKRRGWDHDQTREWDKNSYRI